MRRGGTIYVQMDGETLEAKGSWTYNLGHPTRTTIVGSAEVAGYSETPGTPFLEGAITDSPELDLARLLQAKDVTVTLELANGKTIAWTSAWYAGEGTGSTEEGEIPVRFESRQPGEEIT